MSPTSHSVFIIANPISGRGRGRDATERLRERLEANGLGVRVQFTERSGHARDLASALPEDVTRLVVVGGDGTVNEVVCGLSRDDVALAVLPMGTANLLGTALRMKRDPDHTVRTVLEGRVSRFDVGQVGEDRRFIAVAGIGFDAAVAAGVGQARTGAISKASYVRPTLRALRHHSPTPLDVVIDGEPITRSAAWVVVCNVPRFAAYFRFTPDADPSDGWFDCFLLHARSRTAMVAAHARALLGRRTGAAAATYRRGRRIEISTPTPVPYELDGDYAAETPLTIELLPAAISVLRPPP